MVKLKEPSDVELQRYWSSVYNRLERGLAWILVSAGMVILLGWGAWEFVRAMVQDTEMPGILLGN